ncbi:MAG TPA: hypothetical protein VMV59_10645 [Candidatus Dormibacteraeota bacterium]|nr:hypothetical protein [Candidatus Dormibacteraeota bacterium]
MKNTVLKCTVVALAGYGIALGAQAQSSSAAVSPPAPPAKVFFFRGTPGMAGGTFANERIMGGFNSAVVRNAPFTAQVTHESIQVLADGNRIDRKDTGTIARDSVGRTRREMSLPAIGPLAASGAVPRLIFIKDPAAGKNYVLDEQKKTALVMNISFGKKFRAFRFADSPMGAKEPVASTESLGTKTMDGLTVQGTRTTRTIPAGQIGNEKPIVITIEKWYSPDLQTVVSLTRTDPRFGTTKYQLTNVDRAEPPQSLFIVPQDYTVKPMGAFKRKFGKPGMPAPPPPGNF